MDDSYAIYIAFSPNDNQQNLLVELMIVPYVQRSHGVWNQQNDDIAGSDDSIRLNVREVVAFLFWVSYEGYQPPDLTPILEMLPTLNLGQDPSQSTDSPSVSGGTGGADEAVPEAKRLRSTRSTRNGKYGYSYCNVDAREDFNTPGPTNLYPLWDYPLTQLMDDDDDFSLPPDFAQPAGYLPPPGTVFYLQPTIGNITLADDSSFCDEPQDEELIAAQSELLIPMAVQNNTRFAACSIIQRILRALLQNYKALTLGPISRNVTNHVARLTVRMQVLLAPNVGIIELVDPTWPEEKQKEFETNEEEHRWNEKCDMAARSPQTRDTPAN